MRRNEVDVCIAGHFFRDESPEKHVGLKIHSKWAARSGEFASCCSGPMSEANLSLWRMMATKASRPPGLNKKAAKAVIGINAAVDAQMAQSAFPIAASPVGRGGPQVLKRRQPVNPDPERRFL